jgi:hypothetical protein
MTYYIRLRGQQQGPFSADQLQKLAARGRFSRHHEVSTDGISWQRAEGYPELFPKPPAPLPRRQEPVAAVAVEGAYGSGVSAEGYAMTAADPAAPDVEWYYTHGGSEQGPLGTSELKRLIGFGQVVSEDHVWTDGMANWQRVRDVPELARQLTSPSAAEPAAIDGAPPLAPLAIASFVLGLVGATIVPILGSILAIVFGHVALSQIRQAKGRLGGKGMSLAGLILGYLVIIPAIIVGIVYVAILALAPRGTNAAVGGNFELWMLS